jgi:hypothetical protein
MPSWEVFEALHGRQLVSPVFLSANNSVDFWTKGLVILPIKDLKVERSHVLERGKSIAHQGLIVSFQVFRGQGLVAFYVLLELLWTMRKRGCVEHPG